MIELLVLYLVGGALAGILAGMFGVGGGTLLVPLFIFTLQGVMPDGYVVHAAVASSLACIIVSSANSAWSQHRAGMVDWTLVRWLGAGLLAGVALGSFYAVSVSGEALKLLIICVLMFAAVQQLSGWVPKQTPLRMNGKTAVPIGVVVGAVSSMAGLGGGLFIVPLLRLSNIDIHRAIACSAACGLFISVAGLAMYSLVTPAPDNLPEYATGFVYWPAVVCVGLASGAMARFGVWLNHRIEQKLLRWLYALKSLVVMAWLVFGA